MIKLSILTIALFASMSANAAYKIYIPIEAKLGGSLPDNTLAWVGVPDGGVVGGGGGGEVVNGDGGNEGNEGDIEQSKIAECDKKAGLAKNVFATDFSDVSYVSHKYGAHTIAGETKTGCRITVEVPAKKGFECTGNNIYAEQISDRIKSIGFDGGTWQYAGTCS